MADYYLAGPGATLAAAMPPHGADRARRRFKTVRIVGAHGRAALDVAERLRSQREPTTAAAGHAQREALQLLKGAPDGLAVAGARERGISAPSSARLKALGLVAIREERVDRDPFEHAVLGDRRAPAPRER